jgi:predicted ferric reductase
MNARSRRVVASLGPALLIATAVGYLVLWLVARPENLPTSRYFGEFFGAEAVLLLSLSLVLMTLLTPIEYAFGGLDHVALWHRRVAVAGVLLLVPHLALVISPPSPYTTTVGKGLGSLALAGLAFLTLWAVAPSLRATSWSRFVRYLAGLSNERWVSAHRLTGLFVAAALAHGAIVDPVLHQSTLLRVTYLIVGCIGVAAYAYRELFARFVVPNFDYTVIEAERPNDTTLAVRLEPTREQISFVPGQFIFLSLGGVFGWQRHAFSVASAPSDRILEVSIRSAGDFTSELHEKLRPGTPAKATGPFGGFDYRLGGQEQIWIAGGIGVTPFMSWIRSIDQAFDTNVQFFYSVAQESEALYLDEIESAHQAHPSFDPHVLYSNRDGQLTAEKVMADESVNAEAWVYMCGPPGMMKAFSEGFHKQGLPSSHIRWEQFNLR